MNPSSKIKILLADDEPDTLRLFQDHLGDEGYDVLTASEGKEAMQLVRTQTPDVLILDLRMPALDGEKILETISAEKLAPAMKILVFTGFNDFGRTRERIMRLYGARVSAYLEKPVDISDLRNALDSCCPRAASD